MRLLIFVFFAFISFANAQTDSLAVLKGVVKDNEDDSLIAATMKIMQNGELVKGTITDYDGNYSFSLAPGKYDLEVSYTGYVTILTTGINLEARQTLRYDVEMISAAIQEICRLHFTVFKTPLIDFDPGNTGTTIISDQIRKMY